MAGPSESAVEQDADQATVRAVAALHGAGTAAAPGTREPRLRSGLRLSRCGASLPALRDTQAMIGASETLEKQAGADIEKLEKDQSTIQAGEDTKAEVSNALRRLKQILTGELADAGSDQTKQREAQKSYEDGVQRVRESYRMIFDMQARWGFKFTSETANVEFNKTEGRLREKLVPWSKEELTVIDNLLKRLPGGYLANAHQRIGEFRRVPFSQGTSEAGADISGADLQAGRPAIVRMYDLGFKEPKNIEFFILHEIGHSTDPQRAVGGFNLPDAEWMALSGWRTSTRDTLGADLGLDKDAAKELLAELDRQKSIGSNLRRPVLVNGRLVTFYQYEKGLLGAPPRQFVHYDAKHDNEFYRDRARRDPGEDLADSFAAYLRYPDAAKKVFLENAKTPNKNKWTYLTKRYPEPLQPSR